MFVKKHIHPILQKEEEKNSVFSLMSILSNLFRDQIDSEIIKNHSSMINQFKQELKYFERLFRVFEMTYIDMKDKMQEIARN